MRLLHDGAAYLPAMLAAIRTAEREILLEMYWFGSDETGQSFARALEERAQLGVRVCVTFDAIGSLEADRGMFERMRAAGCGVLEWNPPRLFRRRFSLSGLNRRNHRKLLVVDGRLGFTGGVNLGNPWASVAQGGHGFRDDMIVVEGPAVKAMRAVMLGSYRGPHRDAALADMLGSDAAVGSSRVRVVANDRKRHRRAIERVYLEAIRGARSRILIANSYFLPGLRFRRALSEAVRRGANVRVLLPAESDVPIVGYASRRLYPTLLRHGIALYEWGHGVMHCKTAVIDDGWCTVGTHNLDRRSWAYNLEINVFVEDAQTAGALRTRIEQDLAASVAVDGNTLRFRPLGVRVLELLSYLFWRLL